MRRRRLEIADHERVRQSALICSLLAGLVDPSRVRTVVTFVAVAGEPDLTVFDRWCAARGIRVVAPGSTARAMPPIDVREADVVVVPGLAFTTAGQRLGQGGGWYDRYLAQRRADAIVLGVCFAEQLVDAVPTDAHDVAVDQVVSDRLRR